MAYGHSWRGSVELTESLLGDLAMLLLHAEIQVCGWNGEGSPELNYYHVRFNGSRSLTQDAECFAIHAGLNDGACQTAAKPYDQLVCAMLLRMLHHNPALHIESDGRWRDWSQACDLYLQVFDELPLRPQSIAG